MSNTDEKQKWQLGDGLQVKRPEPPDPETSPAVWPKELMHPESECNRRKA